ncbi:hypothetical protein LOTGIDRAFT_238955 [Lottia gigantea]|uniref:Uncharacterized protein n=1 Tax=Lottia gigantea TaxID=225164 RepID=V4APA6_LOTGI|nr:hypothetical protein LOTGIDRAFT_238955 [Lottia gigantea]ESO99027.1 hypothetical protein LOTGIDRAFT_238955 [Lottia gigantea]
MNTNTIVMLLVVMIVVAVNAYDERQISPQAALCMENMERCSGQYRCCKGYNCEKMGNRRVCVRNSGGNGNCVSYGDRCTLNGSRRCCRGTCRRGMNGRSTCR